MNNLMSELFLCASKDDDVKTLRACIEHVAVNYFFGV